MSNEEIKAVLDEVVRQQEELKNEFHKKKKDMWDKMSIASSFISGVILAVLGIYFTQSYNRQQTQLVQQQAEENRRQIDRDNTLKEHQMRLAEIQTVGTFMPYLAGPEENRKTAAILAIKELTNTKMAGDIAAIFQGPGSIQAMRTIGSKGNQSDKSVATETLATIASTSKPVERLAAVDALRVINNDPLEMQAPDGSTVKVEITSEGTSPLVTYSLNGETQALKTGNSFSFQLHKSEHDPSILVITVNFTNNDGGVYMINVTGSGGTVNQFRLRQSEGLPVASIAYTFDIT